MSNYDYTEKEGGKGTLSPFTMYFVTKNAKWNFHVTVNDKGTNLQTSNHRDHISFKDGTKFYFLYETKSKKWNATNGRGYHRNLDYDESKIFYNVIDDMQEFGVKLNGILIGESKLY